MRKGWKVIAFCAALGACGQGHDKTGNDTTRAGDIAAVSAGDTAGTGAVTTATAASGSPPPAFTMCSSCHSVKPGGSGVGPSLAGVFGRKAGSMPGYAYSDALKKSGIVWDAKSLDTWLQGPMKMVPGTKMVLGLSDPAGRKAVIGYLETLK